MAAPKARYTFPKSERLQKKTPKMEASKTESTSKALDSYTQDTICNLYGITSNEYGQRERYVMDIRASFENILGQEFDAQLHTHQDRLKGFLMAQSQVQDWKQKAISFIAEKDTDNDDADDLFWESLVSWVSQEWSNTKSPKTEEVNTDKTGRSASFDAFDWKRILVRVQVPKKNATFDFMVGAIEAIAPFDKIFRRGLTQELFLEAVWKAIDVPEGKRLSWTKELIYVSGDTRWNLHKKEDFNAALLRFEESKDEDAKSGMMIVTIEDEKPRVDMTEFWRNISSQG